MGLCHFFECFFSHFFAVKRTAWRNAWQHRVASGWKMKVWERTIRPATRRSPHAAAAPLGERQTPLGGRDRPVDETLNTQYLGLGTVYRLAETTHGKLLARRVHPDPHTGRPDAGRYRGSQKRVETGCFGPVCGGPQCSQCPGLAGQPDVSVRLPSQDPGAGVPWVRLSHQPPGWGQPADEMCLQWFSSL